MRLVKNDTVLVVELISVFENTVPYDNALTSHHITC